MVKVVPREVPRPKPEGPQALRVFYDTHKAFPHVFILSSFRTSKEGLLSANGVPRGSIGKWRGHEALHICRVKSQYASPGCRKNAY